MYYMLFRVFGIFEVFFFFLFFLNRSHVHCAEKKHGKQYIYIYIFFFLYRYFRNISLEYFSIKKFSFSTIFFLFSSQCFLIFQFFSFILLLSLSSPYPPFSLSLLLFLSSFFSHARIHIRALSLSLFSLF